ncbi:hypothetical protein AYI69_g43 [Smittium culicis]|uniref:Uncharacterized protein n=1 Tax=Smittium culicis TaxID=133412 RepID=A0A1R1YU45_9FUNG|nr:hypothetical protein AYI69_g43 [Smittium culicis]
MFQTDSRGYILFNSIQPNPLPEVPLTELEDNENYLTDSSNEDTSLQAGDKQKLESSDEETSSEEEEDDELHEELTKELTQLATLTVFFIIPFISRFLGRRLVYFLAKKYASS